MFRFYRDITFVPPDETLANFPVMVRFLGDSSMANRLQTTGFDTQFELLDGTVLEFELDYYDSATGSGCWWVKIPIFSNSAPTIIRMRYGNAEITTNQSVRTVWDSDYVFVAHYNIPDVVADSSQYEQTVVNRRINGGTNPVTQLFDTDIATGRAATIYGRAQIEDSSMLVYSVFSVGRYDTTWCDNVSLKRGAANQPPNESNKYNLQWVGICKSNFYLYQYAASQQMFKENVAANTWITSSMTSGNPVGTYLRIVDGVESTVTTDTKSSGVNYTLTFNECGWNSGAYTSQDEIRLSSIQRSAAWLRYEHNQVLNYFTYTTNGKEYTSGGSQVRPVRPYIMQGGFVLC